MKKLFVAMVFMALMLSGVSQAQAAMVFSDTGADEVLKVYLNNDRPTGGNNLTIKLFCTNVTPADTDTASTYTECAGGGYSNADCVGSADPRACCTGSGTGECAGKTLTNGSWTVTTGNDPSDATYAALTWTFTGTLTTNGTIFGYYIVDADNTLITSEAKTAFTPENSGDNIVITPKIQASKGTPN